MAFFHPVKQSILLIAFILLHTPSKAQIHPNSNPCGTDEVHKQALLKKPLLRIQHQKSEETILNHIRQRRNLKPAATDYTIPVVVHIIHNNGNENISDAQVIAGIQDLNDAFNNSGFYDTTLGTATEIHFCLARQDESGNPTSGITRNQSVLTNMLSPTQDLALKNIVRWDPKKYLNIWVVKEISSESHGSGVAGYAHFPYAHGKPEDGIVCEANYFGTSPQHSKVLVHEAGHYLGLYHTFEGGCTNNDCLTDGDHVCDTPPDATSSPSGICITDMNSCYSDEDDQSTNNPFRPVSLGGLGDQNDNTINFMDYSPMECQIIFTNGQKERMINTLTSLRNSLLESQACVDPCHSPIQISVSPGNTTTTIGTTINFINTSTGATHFEWYINETKFSEAQNASYTFNEKGNFTITLIASNSEVLCKQEATFLFRVDCNTKASFIGPDNIRPAEPVTFTNTTNGIAAWQWFIDGNKVSTDQNCTHTFTAAGGYRIHLVAFDGQCYDTSRTKFVQAGNCNPGNQGNIWYFGGHAGLEFIGDSIFPILVPVTPNFGSDEASISMSDASGKFLFFANPEYVFNKNRTVMPNGSGLLGNSSASQMAAVVHPSNENSIYLFTLDAFGNSKGLRYSVIDMSLDGGLGDVIAATKNTLLLTPATEKITTVKHANGTDTWVIAHGIGSNAFYAYLVNTSGVSPSPVISNAGTVNSGMDLGQLKASPDGCRLAAALYEAGIVEIFNFDNQTGIVSSPLTISGTEFEQCYGIEFSPDGSKLYVGGSDENKDIYQFDLNKTTPAAIINSRFHVGTLDWMLVMGGFQLGPQGKIYIARNGDRYLATINNPNAPGHLCEFVQRGVNLGTRRSGNSLPSFAHNYFYNPKPLIMGPDTVCISRSNVAYNISHSTCGTDVSTWSLKGKGHLVSGNDTQALINFSGEEGTDTLIVNRNSPCGPSSDTMLIVIKKSSFDIPDTVQCSAAPVLLDAGPAFKDYLWHDNSTSPTFLAHTHGKYWVMVTSPEGCKLTDTIRVNEHIIPKVDLGADFQICTGTVTVLKAGSGYTSYQWQDHSANPTYTAYLPGKYWVTVSSACGSTDSDTIEISPTSNSVIDLGSDLGLCQGESLTLNAGNNFEEYYWLNGATGNTQLVSSKGVYSVIGINSSGCYGYGEITIYEKTNCCDKIEIPSLITPNNDELNDKFIISCIENKEWQLEIYNRWGKLIYISTNYQNDWNGNDLAEGIYFYLLKKEDVTYQGWVQITR